MPDGCCPNCGTYIGRTYSIGEANSTATTTGNTTSFSFDWALLSASGDEDALEKAAHAEMCRRRYLGYLYRPPIKTRLRLARRPVLVIFQPCWSRNRWKSLT